MNVESSLFAVPKNQVFSGITIIPSSNFLGGTTLDFNCIKLIFQESEGYSNTDKKSAK